MEQVKQEMTQEVTAKVEQLETAKAELIVKVQEKQEATEQDNTAIVELEDELEQVQADKNNATDVKEAKKLVNRQQELTEDIELQSSVNKARQNKRTEELEQVIEELLTTHKKAVFLYKSLEQKYSMTVSLSSLKEDNEKLQELSKSINFTLSYVSRVLIQIGINKQGDSFYNNFHLSQRDLYSDLSRLFNKEEVRMVQA